MTSAATTQGKLNKTELLLTSCVELLSSSFDPFEIFIQDNIINKIVVKGKESRVTIDQIIHCSEKL
ncbi:hypothetical protein ACHAWX_006878 [Stephanocyclus meneghinianus]